MGKTEIAIFITAISLLIFLLVVGFIVLILQYRQKRLLHDYEKANLQKQYELDLATTKLQSQLETMQQIGQEIHDSVAQKLVVASIFSQKLNVDNHKSGEELSMITNVIHNALNELRNISRELTNGSIQNSSLEELIEYECDLINQSQSCKTIFTHTVICKVSVIIKTNLLRIVQEFISNSLKHADCTEITIEMSTIDQNLFISLQDNGIGFEVKHHQSKGIGLDNIRRRVASINGNYELTSASGKGTRLEIKIPISDV